MAASWWWWWWLAAPAVLAAGLWNYALQLRPAFPSSALGLDAELLALLQSHPRAALTEAERQQFNATGLLVVRGAIPSAVVERLRELLDQEPPVASPLFGGSLTYVISHAWAHYEGLRQLTAASLSASLAAQLLAPSSGDGGGGGDDGSSVRLVNSVAYGIGRGQNGADWHTDEISYRPVRRSHGSSLRDDLGVSVWIPLQQLESPGSGGDADAGGGLKVVPLNTASAQCYDAKNLDTVNGRLLRGGGGGGAVGTPGAVNAKGIAECERTLAQRGVSVGAMEPGDLLLFGRAVWHRTEPPRAGFPAPIRWSYTERYVPDGSLYSDAAEQHWLHEYLTQPLCDAGLRDGDPLSGDCFPSLPPAPAAGEATVMGEVDHDEDGISSRSTVGVVAELPRPAYSGTTVVERVSGIARHIISQATRTRSRQQADGDYLPRTHHHHQQGQGEASGSSGQMMMMLRSWGLAFAWTQLLECPVYMLLQPRVLRSRETAAAAAAAAASPGGGSGGSWLMFDLGVAFGASLISHPPATAFYWEICSWPSHSTATNPHGQEQLERWLQDWAWEVVEVCVFLVELLWLLWAHADADGGAMLRDCGWLSLIVRAGCCSLCANMTSIAGGVVINAWAPHLLGA